MGGAVHSVVFGGFSYDALAGRILDAQSRIVITADCVMRGPKPIQLKDITDKAVISAAAGGFSVEKVVCLKRLGNTANHDHVKHGWNEKLDVWFEDFIGDVPNRCQSVWMDSEDPLFM